MLWPAVLLSWYGSSRPLVLDDETREGRCQSEHGGRSSPGQARLPGYQADIQTNIEEDTGGSGAEPSLQKVHLYATSTM